MLNSICIGYVTKTHGLNGMFSIKLIGTKEFCESCINIKSIYINDDIHLSVQNIRLNSKIFLKTKVKEINNREDAKLILRKDVYIKKGEIVEIDELIKKQNKFVGFEVINSVGEKIGVIKKIDYNRIQPIMIIQSSEKQILAPYIQTFISKIDMKNKNIIVDFPEGLIETCSF
jgi:16S rRNA processing protein RimM